MPFHWLLTYPLLFVDAYLPILHVPVKSDMCLCFIFLYYFVESKTCTLLVSRRLSDFFYFLFCFLLRSLHISGYSALLTP